MGEVIQLSGRLRERTVRTAGATRPRPARPAVTFFFDLASPFTYLAAERVDRLMSEVRWVPAVADGLPGGLRGTDAVTAIRLRAAAEARAEALHLPLVWPDPMPAAVPAAMRVAAYAVAEGRGPAFVLAATRLAFCGGFNLDDPEILAEAAGAASLSPSACRRAAVARSLDAPMAQAGRRLVTLGADRLPVVRVHRTLFCGEARVLEASAAARAGQAVARPFMPGPPAPGPTRAG